MKTKSMQELLGQASAALNLGADAIEWLLVDRKRLRRQLKAIRKLTRDYSVEAHREGRHIEVHRMEAIHNLARPPQAPRKTKDA